MFSDFLEEFYKGQLECGLFTTVNENKENVIIKIMEDRLEASTIQSNGWTRVNTYYNDAGHTVEEEYVR